MTAWDQVNSEARLDAVVRLARFGILGLLHCLGAISGSLLPLFAANVRFASAQTDSNRTRIGLHKNNGLTAFLTKKRYLYAVYFSAWDACPIQPSPVPMFRRNSHPGSAGSDDKRWFGTAAGIDQGGWAPVPPPAGGGQLRFFLATSRSASCPKADRASRGCGPYRSKLAASK